MDIQNLLKPFYIRLLIETGKDVMIQDLNRQIAWKDKIIAIKRNRLVMLNEREYIAINPQWYSYSIDIA